MNSQSFIEQHRIKSCILKQVMLKGMWGIKI